MRFASQEKPALSSLPISQQGKRTHQLRHSSTGFIFHCLFLLGVGSTAFPQQQDSTAPTYLSLSTPQQVLPNAQAWEGKEFPHTLSVLELNRDGFRYWGWYGLNEGKGIGLARSNDLVHWTKYEKNPLWTNARWPSVLPGFLIINRKRLSLHGITLLSRRNRAKKENSLYEHRV